MRSENENICIGWRYFRDGPWRQVALAVLCLGAFVAASGCAPAGESEVAVATDAGSAAAQDQTPGVAASESGTPEPGTTTQLTARSNGALAEGANVFAAGNGFADAGQAPELTSAASLAEPQVFVIPAGTRLVVDLIDRIGTALNSPGDMFLASLAEPITIDGVQVIDRGVLMRGRIVEVSRPGRLQGRARISTVLTHIEPAGDPISIGTLPFIEEAEQNLGRDATLGGLGAAAGAAIGALTGGGRGAAIGAAAGGVGTVAVTRGDDLEYPPETRMEFELESAVSVPRIEVELGESLQ